MYCHIVTINYVIRWCVNFIISYWFTLSCFWNLCSYLSLCPCKYSVSLSIIVNICVIYFRRTAVGLLRYFSVRYIFIRKYFRTKVALGKRCYYFGYFMLRVSFYVQQCIISWVPLGIDNLISNLSEYHYYSHTVIVTAKNIA